MRTGSVCTGYGGLDMAVHEVLGGELAWVADIDPGASAILAHRFPSVPNLGDITTVDWSVAGPVDVLTAGFPCTDVSMAGARAGLRKGTRSGVWIEVARAIKELRPSLVVIENVRGLLSARGDEPAREHLAAEAARDARVIPQLLRWLASEEAIAAMKGDARRVRECRTRTARVVGLRKRAVARCQWHERRLVRAIGTVLGNLADLGFDAEGCCVSASDVGAPHRRERVFIIAWPAADARGKRRDGWPGLGGDGWPAPVREQAGGHGRNGGSAPAEDADRAASGEWRLTASGQAPRGRPRADACGSGGVRAIADAASDGRDARRPESAGLLRRPDAAVCGDGIAADTPGERHRHARQEGERGLPATAIPSAPADAQRAELTREPQAGRGTVGGTLAAGSGPRAIADAESSGREACGTVSERAHEGPGQGSTACATGPAIIDWGAYELAIRRWERVLGRPAPAPTEPGRTGQRLSPAFVEWLMGLPEGWVTDIPGLSRNAQLKALGNGVVPQQAAMALRILLERAGIAPLVAAEGAA